jgi:hypothetical protein
MLAPQQQADFVEEMPDVLLPVRGGWGRIGANLHERTVKRPD